MAQSVENKQKEPFFFPEQPESDTDFQYSPSVDYYNMVEKENETRSNRAIAYTSLLYVLLPFILGILDTYGDSIAVRTANRYVLFPLSIIIILVFLIVKKKQFIGSWIKYVLIGEIIFGTLAGFFMFSTNISYILFLPLFCAMRFFNSRLMKLTTVLMAVLFIFVCILSLYLDSRSMVVAMFHWSTAYNPWQYPVEAVLYVIIPIVLVGLCVAAYTRGIVLSGKATLRKQAITTENGIRVNAEIKTAAVIQQSGLPKEEMLTNNRNFAVTGKTVPTRVVGGDFYDYFMIDDHTLAFVIADVSDKGLPAAMFMMACKKAVRCAIECSHSLNKAIELANKLICEDNETGMFVTMWLGMIDIQTGVGKYANAGHLPPMVRKEDGTVTFIENEPDLFLGNFSEMTPQVHPFRLMEGDELLLYTDGLTDAVNAAGENYGSDRLMKAFQAAPSEPEAIRDHLLNQVQKFSSDADQIDDITLLLLKCYDIDEPDRFVMDVQSGKEGTEEIINTVQKKLMGVGCPDEKRRNISVILDELLSNIAEYAYENAGNIHLKCMVGGNFIRFDLDDEGPKFDPLKKEDPQFPEEPEIGGLGIWLVKNLADEIEYKNVNGKNRTTVKVIWHI